MSNYEALAAASMNTMGNIGAGYITAAANKRGAKEAAKYNERAQERAYEQNIAMWNMANAYNTPAAQVQRLRDAGLSPALMYGSSANTGNAPSAPEYQASMVSPTTYHFDNPFSGSSSAYMAAKSYSLQESKILNDMANENARTSILAARDARDSGVYDYVVEAARLRNDKLVQEMQINERTQARLDAQFNFTMALENAKLGLSKSQLSLAERQFTHLLDKYEDELNLAVEEWTIKHNEGKLKEIQAKIAQELYDGMPKSWRQAIHNTSEIFGIVGSALGGANSLLKLLSK